jgi:uncharacterized damage-inducible protein DinB
LAQWQNIRRLTYDYLEMLEPDQLVLTLPFPESKSIGYQFWCMTGAQESYLRNLQHGEWQGFSSSLDQLEQVTPTTIKAQMEKADQAMAELLGAMDLQARLKDGQHGYEVVQRIIEHEMHHHGQLINLMFCHHLPIPPSWRDAWALAYED